MILCVGNYASDVGYAWHLIERFWCEIAARHPGRVAISFSKVRKVSTALLASGARILEHEFRLESPETREFVRQHGIRHLYLSDRPVTSRWYRALRATGVETITVHDHIYVDQPPPGAIRGALRWALARVPGWSADALLSVSPLMHRRHVQDLKLPPHKCHLAVNGIDLIERPTPHDIRSELGIPPNVAIAVSCGRVCRQKGVHTIMAAAQQLKGDVACVHIGDGPMLEAYRAEGSPVHFLGQRTDVAAILEAADFAVHASSSEGLSLAILEFMRAGLPVLVPNIPSVSQTIEHAVSGLHYRAGDAEDLAQMALALTDKDWRLRLGLGARSAVLHYDIRTTIATVGRVLERVTQRS